MNSDVCKQPFKCSSVQLKCCISKSIARNVKWKSSQKTLKLPLSISKQPENKSFSYRSEFVSGFRGENHHNIIKIKPRTKPDTPTTAEEVTWFWWGIFARSGFSWYPRTDQRPPQMTRPYSSDDVLQCHISVKICSYGVLGDKYTLCLWLIALEAHYARSKRVTPTEAVPWNREAAFSYNS